MYTSYTRFYVGSAVNTSVQSAHCENADGAFKPINNLLPRDRKGFSIEQAVLMRGLLYAFSPDRENIGTVENAELYEVRQ